jgi:uncharacterized membrane protein YgcG
VPNQAAGRTDAGLAARRILQTEDFLSPDSPLEAQTLLVNRAHAATMFHLELASARTQLQLIRDFVAPIRMVPTRLVGRAVQPNGAPGSRLQVELTVPANGRLVHRHTTTDKDGEFSMALPAGLPFPTGNALSFVFRGANLAAPVTVASTGIAPNGLMGNLRLPIVLDPLPQSIIASLVDLLPADRGQGIPPPPDVAATFPDLRIGEDGSCQRLYHTDISFDRFPYGVFIRLVEPRTSIVNPIVTVAVPGSSRRVPVAGFLPPGLANATIQYVDRVPVDQPVSVDGFRDQLIGVGNGTVVTPFERVPMAGTLGLGYVLRMAQLWTPKGLTLGDLVYSLPLAPGEQQRVAVFERRETSMVRESETLSADEQQEFSQDTDASTESVFNSAFDESASGGSSFNSHSKSKGHGWTALVYSAGGGSSNSSGSSTSWMEGHRDTAARATEDVHTAVQRQASARRRLARTGMRLASTFESAEVTTKVITNHNHTRALTLQYWEVQRLYEVSTTIEGVTLACLVPLQVVRFLPAGQPITLSTTATLPTRVEILTRYGQVLKHADILERWLPSGYRHGLSLLRQFAADPTATFQPAGAAAEDVIHFSLTGTFLPFEQIYVSAVTKRGTRLGPVQLTGIIGPVPEVWGDPAHAFPTEDVLIANLRGRRMLSAHLLEGDLAVPPTMARNDIVGFEISRQFQQFDYDLVNPAVQVTQLFSLSPEVPPDHLISGTVHLTPQKLEQNIGGPFVWNFNARIHTLGGGGDESYAQNYLGSRQQLPPAPFPVPAVQLSPVLRYSQLLEIERMLQHVVRNTVHYSKAVWLSLTPEERVIMLEGYTIGVPPGGIEDESQNIPLLNCVENRVIGFYGNSMMMPFIIPRSIADSMDITNADVQNTLLEFHESGFTPVRSIVALPTRGVLAEAVLGHCPSAEKVDLTRFWNWQDSPADAAPNIADVTLPTDKSTTSALQAPAALAGIAPLINNINATPTVPGSDAALVQALAQAAAQQQGFDAGKLTGAEALSKLILGDQRRASEGRKDALETTKQLNAQAMATVGNILGGIYGKNPTAGSTAAGAVYGNKGATASSKPGADDENGGGGEGGEGGGGNNGHGGGGGGGETDE